MKILHCDPFDIEKVKAKNDLFPAPSQERKARASFALRREEAGERRQTKDGEGGGGRGGEFSPGCDGHLCIATLENPGHPLSTKDISELGKRGQKARAEEPGTELKRDAIQFVKPFAFCTI